MANVLYRTPTGSVSIDVSALGLSGLAALGSPLANARRPRPVEPPFAREYLQGLDGARKNVGPDARFVTSHDRMIVSAFACGRAVFETVRFAAARHAAEWRRIGGDWIHGRGTRDVPSRAQVLGQRLGQGASAQAVNELRDLVCRPGDLYFVVNRVEVRSVEGLGVCCLPRPEAVPPWIGESARFERCFANGAIARYLLPLGVRGALR